MNDDKLEWIFASGDNQQLADRYYRWATQYDADHDGWEWIGPAKAVEQLCALGTMSTVLDVGCGTGRVGAELAATGWDGTLVGVDLSAGTLAVAAEAAYYERLVQASLTEIPLEDGSVDAVIATGVFTHGAGIVPPWQGHRGRSPAVGRDLAGVLTRARGGPEGAGRF